MRETVLQGKWEATDEEVSSLRPYPRPDSRGRMVMFLPGRDPYVSLVLVACELVAGRSYFFRIRPSVMGNPSGEERKEGRLRRTVMIYAWEDERGTEIPEVGLDYLTRPLTVLEAWRATREFSELRRAYCDGGEDRLLRLPTERWEDVGAHFIVELSRGDDVEMLGVRGPCPAERMQELLDELDWRTPGVERPDWRLM